RAWTWGATVGACACAAAATVAPHVQARTAAAPMQAQADADQQLEQGDEPPSWVTEFSDDTAVAQEAPAVAAAPAAARAPAAPRYAYVITPVPEIGWDGNWPGLAAKLPLRGVAQQLALQTELVECRNEAAVTTFRLRVPIDTLRASGNTEKLAAALQEYFPATKVAVDIDIGAVWYTASVEAQALREECQRQAEESVAAEPFVQDLMREFGAFVVPGSIRPAPGAAA
ncbi:MAG TPA: DNA polymerase III subunit gamma/tau, partial [Telluria sp.]|nr:DNA polymerase III subunit gamma/tau [Telluria sp.]